MRIDIPELQPSQKPLYIKNQNLPRGAYRRIGGSDIRCTQEDLVAFYKEIPSGVDDVNIVADSGMNDVDEDALNVYKKAIFDANPNSDILAWTDIDILYGTSCAKKLEEQYRLTTAGALVFGRSQSLRRLFSSVRVDYIRVDGRQWVDDPENRFQSLDMRGPLMTLINRVITAISDDLPKSFKISATQGSQRTEVPKIPHGAIREAVVNAMMHRNYKISKPIQIIRYSNRLVISNPGYSLKSQDNFDEPGSITRNPNIAAILHETRFAETKGSGMRAMKKFSQEAGLTVPTFDSDRDRDSFTVTFLFHQLLDERSWAWLSTFSHLSLSEDQLTALVFVQQTGAISNAAFRALTGLDTLLASTALRKLRELDLLEKVGSGSNTYYEAGTALRREMPEEESIQDNIQAVPTDRRNIRERLMQSLTLETRKKILPVLLKGTAKKKKLKTPAIEDIIVEICSQGDFSAEELSILLDRNQVYVAQNYLTPLVQAGRIVQTIPETPKSPDQKYRKS